MSGSSSTSKPSSKDGKGDPNLPVIKIVVIGAGGVGKTAITTRFVKDEFSEHYDPTIEDSYRKQVEIDHKGAVLEILDTAGNDSFKMMRDLYLGNSDAYVVVYSIAARASFLEVPTLLEDICRIKPDRSVAPAILVGNKCDLPSREISKEQGKELALKHGCMFIEVSAKVNVNVDAVFTSLSRDLVAARHVDQAAPSGCKCTLL